MMGRSATCFLHSTCARSEGNTATEWLSRKGSKIYKVALGQLLLGSNIQPSQALVTQVTMARNHFPRTVTGIPPALAMTGRSDLLAGHAPTAWNHDPHAIGPAARSINSMRHIPNARNAIITADAKRALATCTNRHLPDRSQEFSSIGAK